CRPRRHVAATRAHGRSGGGVRPRPGSGGHRRRTALPGTAPSGGRHPPGLTARGRVAIVSPYQRRPRLAGAGPRARGQATMLQDRVAIITGGGRGIGREHALLFASLGAKVVVNDLGGAVDGSGTDVSAAQSVVDEITAAGGQAVANTDSVSSFAG